LANVIPFINFGGNGLSAARFYETVFGGKAEVQADSDGDVAHLEFTSGDLHFMGNDSPSDEPGRMVLNCDNEEQLRSFYAKLAEGGAEAFAPTDSGWGAIIAHCVDQFGVTWLLNYDPPGG
jgi:PhnB protein